MPLYDRADYVDEEGKVNYERLILDLVADIKAADPDLDISRLWKVTAGSTYGDALREVSNEVGRAQTPTDRETGSGVAMLVHQPDHDILVTSIGLFDALLGDEERGRISVNTVHHELCHAHDAAEFQRLGILGKPAPGKFPELFRIIEPLWTEYFANRRSFITLPNGESLQAPVLGAEVGRVAADVKECIRKYGWHHDVSRLMDEVLPHVRFAFQLAGYVLGTLKASGRTLQEAHPDVAAVVAGSWLGPAWKPADEHLDEMYRTHGAWPGAEVFEVLEDVVRHSMERLGLRLSIREGGVWVDVLRTPETT